MVISKLSSVLLVSMPRFYCHLVKLSIMSDNTSLISSEASTTFRTSWWHLFEASASSIRIAQPPRHDFGDFFHHISGPQTSVNPERCSVFTLILLLWACHLRRSLWLRPRKRQATVIRSIINAIDYLNQHALPYFANMGTSPIVTSSLSAFPCKSISHSWPPFAEKSSFILPASSSPLSQALWLCRSQSHQKHRL